MYIDIFFFQLNSRKTKKSKGGMCCALYICLRKNVIKDFCHGPRAKFARL